MDSFPALHTDRLRLRRPVAGDIPRLVQYANHPQISEMTLNVPHPYREKDAISWINMANEGFEDKNHFVFAICKQTDDQFMGGIGLRLNTRFNHAELGFWIGEPFWNNGYVTEATGKILEFGFERIKLQKIFATHFVNNPASGKVMENNGMIQEGVLVDHIRKDDAYLTLIQYRLTRSEYTDRE